MRGVESKANDRLPLAVVTEDLLERICNIPRDFRGGKKSPLDLVRESGYYSASADLGTDDIERYLAMHPRIIDDWLGWSEDKRTTGPYFLRNRHGKFVIGSYPGGFEREYRDPYRACATYIIEETL